MQIPINIFLLAFSIFVSTAVLAQNEFENGDTDDQQKSIETLGSFFKLMSSGDEQSCKATCPDGSEPVPRPGHIPSSNGCGSMGIKLDTSIFPSFENCCNAHDKCYDVCKADRDKCDKGFKDCLDKVCNELKRVHPPDLVDICKNTGGLMHAAAIGLGCTPFTMAQKKACTCSKADKNAKQRYDSNKKKEKLEL
ncbi:group XIIA secretory phospholipase A2-like [Xenia sp. Carnegie-2017]|uniref:group XIIA secretory phospholipase A2-like n=1 Tax=Xenia sp. Carnegie-2017 TaxID=2897299 RepID=UPI001F0383B2|nr:group XIIA secretory phospholipase A2-like [Xenia sp. Carnegie-2017]